MKEKFPLEPELVAQAQAYKNPDHTLIAERVSPRTPPLKVPTFRYMKMKDPYQAFRIADTKVSPTGRVNRIEPRGEKVIDETDDNAIDVPLSHFDTIQRDDSLDVKRMATDLGMSTVKLRHEADVASIYFDADNYVTKETLVGADQLNNVGYAGDPLRLIREKMRAALVKPNVLIFGEDAWAYYSMMADVVKAILGNSGDKGIATPEAVARLFGVQEVLVGEGVVCTSKPGEDPVLVRAWGPHIAGIYRDRAAGLLGGITFGFTAQYGRPVAGTIDDPDVGMRGGQRVRAGESTKTVVCCPHAGFLIEDAVAVS